VGGLDSPLLGFGTPDEADHLLPLPYYSARLEKSAQVKTGPGLFYTVTMTNTNAAARYLQVFDFAGVPADGTIPLLSRSIPIGDSLTLQWNNGHPFSQGLFVCNSTTAASKTLGAADSIFDVTFV
jgi:hypothetical protein